MGPRDFDFFDSEFSSNTEACRHDECDEDGICYECGLYVTGRERTNPDQQDEA